MFRESRKMALIVAVVMLFTTFAACVVSAEAEPVELFVNGSFEIGGGDEWVLTRAEKAMEGPQDGSYYVSINPQGNIRQVISGIKPFTSYTLSYWVKTSTTAAVTLGPSIDYYDASVEGKNLGAFGWPSTFAQAETAEWQKVELQFTSVNNPEVAKLAVYVGNAGAEAVCIDNFSLVEDGGEPNLYLNGNLEIYNPNGTPWKWYTEDGKPDQAYNATTNTLYWNEAEQAHIIGTNGSVTMVHDAVDGNSYFRFEPKREDRYQYLHMNQSVTLTPGNYKLSFRCKASGVPAYPSFKLVTDQVFPEVDLPSVKNVDEWTTYEYYFTVDTTLPYQFRIMAAPYVANISYCIDDLVLAPVTDTNTVYASMAALGSETGQQGVNFIPVSALSEVEPEEDGTRSVSVKTTYVPKTESESFTVINSVYKTENGAKTLVSVSVKDYADITAPTTLVDSVKVPAAEGDETYTVETFIWQSAGGLKPVLTPVVFA